MATCMFMGKEGKFLAILCASIFVVPFSGAFSQNPWEMQSQVLYIVLSILGAFSISRLNPKQRKTVLNSIIVLVVIQGILVILQYFKLDPLFNSKNNPATDLPFGFSCSPNQSGVFFGVTLPLVALVFPWALPLSIFGLLVAKTSSVWIGCLAGSVLASSYIIKWRMETVLLIALATTIVFYGYFEKQSGASIQERLDVYSHTTIAAATGKMPLYINDRVITAKWNPIFGCGIGTFPKLGPHNQTGYIHAAHRYDHAHNDYIEIFFENGYLGLLTIVMVIINGIGAFIRAKKTKILIIVSSCLVVQLVSALGIFVIHTATSGFLLIIMYGLFLGETKRNNPKEIQNA